jgi:choline dehydrogenase-like flavoprotein
MSSTTEATRIDIEPVFFCSQDFDYLIIGGGTAGLVVATRLSENPDIKVGVLEAGPAAFDEPLINIPGRFGESLGTKYDWNFETAPQAGIGGRKLPWARGKVLGGSSALNFMTWNRGCREDYDAWEALGNEGWGWDGLLWAPD